MAETPPAAAPRRTLWRIVLLLLLLVPTIPSLFLLIVSLYGKAAGCDPAGAACVIGGRALGEVAKRSLDAAASFASFFVFLGGLWFAVTLLPLHRAFGRAGARVLAALVAAGWSVIGAIVAGFIALANIAPHCSFN